MPKVTCSIYSILVSKHVLVQWISLQFSVHYCSYQITVFANLPPPSKCRLVWPAPPALPSLHPWLGRTWPVLCWVGCKIFSRSVLTVVTVQLTLASAPSCLPSRTSGPRWSAHHTGWLRRSLQGEIHDLSSLGGSLSEPFATVLLPWQMSWWFRYGEVWWVFFSGWWEWSELPSVVWCQSYTHFLATDS